MKAVQKIIITTAVGCIVIVHGASSCHYTLAQYYDLRGNYESSLYHKYHAGKFLTNYKHDAFEMAFETALLKSKINYHSPTSYYNYYIKDAKEIKSKVLHRDDKELLRSIYMFNDRYFDDSKEALFFKIHQLYDSKHPDYHKYKVIFLDTSASLDFKNSKLARRFLHMLEIGRAIKPLVNLFKQNEIKNPKKHIDNLRKYIQTFADNSKSILKSKDYLLKFEYGLISSRILHEVNIHLINNKKASSYIKEDIEILYKNLEKILKDKQMQVNLNKERGLVDGISYIKEIMKNY